MIISVMAQSDKGIRDLLLRYINSKEPHIIERLYTYYDLNTRFPINYLNLNPTHINHLRDDTIHEAIVKHLRYNFRNKTIDYYDVENILCSKYKDDIIHFLNAFGFKVYNVPRGKTQMFRKGFYEIKPKEEKKKEITLLERGYILETDNKFIIENKLSPIQVSCYTDGWYSCLPYVGLYQSFDTGTIKKQRLEIIHTALYAKAYSLKSTGIWNKCADTMLSLLDWCEADIDWSKIFCIFKKFIDMSFIPFLQK